MQRILAGIDTNSDDGGVRLRHGLVLLLLPHTSMLARRAGARPVHPILRHQAGSVFDAGWGHFSLAARRELLLFALQKV
jgi:hypothetical protein